jgi:hypothetical protein
MMPELRAAQQRAEPGDRRIERQGGARGLARRSPDAGGCMRGGAEFTRRIILAAACFVALPVPLSATPLDPELARLVQAAAPSSLVDYRLPEVADLNGDWELHPDAYRVRADFNGDGLDDTAVLLLRRAGPGIRLLVLLASQAGAPTVTVLEDRPWRAQGFGLAVAAPGRYKTAAGKGYDLGPGNTDPPEIALALPAINRYHFESSEGFWYWDGKKKAFAYIQISD